MVFVVAFIYSDAIILMVMNKWIKNETDQKGITATALPADELRAVSGFHSYCTDGHADDHVHCTGSVHFL